MMGLRDEFRYPSHRKVEVMIGLTSGGTTRTAISNVRAKNGSQQTMKTPVMMANVLAARLSFSFRWSFSLFRTTFLLWSPGLRRILFLATYSYNINERMHVWTSHTYRDPSNSLSLTLNTQTHNLRLFPSFTNESGSYSSSLLLLLLLLSSDRLEHTGTFSFTYRVALLLLVGTSHDSHLIPSPRISDSKGIASHSVCTTFLFLSFPLLSACFHFCRLLLSLLPHVLLQTGTLFLPLSSLSPFPHHIVAAGAARNFHAIAGNDLRTSLEPDTLLTRGSHTEHT